jgi:lysophospholipase L1-like esterase
VRSTKRIFIAIIVSLVIVFFAVLVLAQSSDEKSISKPKSEHSRQYYAALGDSVAAGAGLSEAYDSSACERSKLSYPVKLAIEVDYSLLDYACGGATITNGLNGSQTVNNLKLDSQITQLKQSRRLPSVISITIGANDVDWIRLLQRCYQGECGSVQDEAQIISSVATIQRKLRSNIEHITREYPDARLIITGYYQLFPATLVENCDELTGFDQRELDFARLIQSQINKSVQQATENVPRVTFAPVSFSGHELCTTDSWVQSLAGSAPYHPTEKGQEQIKNILVQTLKKKE